MFLSFLIICQYTRKMQSSVWMGFHKNWLLHWLDIPSTLSPAERHSALMPRPQHRSVNVCVLGSWCHVCLCECLSVPLCTFGVACPLIGISIWSHHRWLVCTCVSFKLINLSMLLWIFHGCVQLCVFLLYTKWMRVCQFVLCLHVCQVWTTGFLPCGRTFQSHPSIISLHYVFISFCVCRALNEQLTALSVSQCYGKISQSVYQKHQSTTGTEPLFNWSGETVHPWGWLTYWILSIAWYLWYDSHNASNLPVIKCTHMLRIITHPLKNTAFNTCWKYHLVYV